MYIYIIIYIELYICIYIYIELCCQQEVHPRQHRQTHGATPAGESANKGLCQWHDDHRCTCERSTASQAATYVPREYTDNLSQSTSMH